MTLKPSDMICFSLYAATHAMQQAYRPLLDEAGITYPQYLVLRVLWAARAPLSVGEIGREVQLDSSTLTPLLKRLESGGLVARRRAEEDERRVMVALTDAGRQLEARVAEVPGCILRKTGLAPDALMRLHGEIMALSDRLRAADGADTE